MNSEAGILRALLKPCAMAVAHFSLASSLAMATTPAGRAVTVIGTVTVRASATAQPLPLRPAMTVSQGDLIETSANGKAKILMNDKTVLDLSASTSFKVEQFVNAAQTGERQVALAVNNGKVRTAVSEPLTGKGKFIIKTKTTTMGVRGTEFIVASQLANLAGASSQKLAQVNTEITVVQGKIEVTDMTMPGGKPIELTQGKQLVTSARIDLNSGVITRAPATSGASGGGGASGSGGTSGEGGEKSGTSSGESKTDSGSGGGGDSGAPVVRDVPPAKLDEMRNESKIGDLSLKDTINVEDKSTPREAPAAPPAAQQNAQAPASGADKKEESRTPSSGGPPPPPVSPGFDAVGGLGNLINSTVSQGLQPGPAGSDFNFKPAQIVNASTGGANTSGPTTAPPIVPTGNVTVTVKFSQ